MDTKTTKAFVKDQVYAGKSKKDEGSKKRVRQGKRKKHILRSGTKS